MARPWRLRHKLIFGLALVVASVALLLGGAVLGLSSYFDTVDTTAGKLEQMIQVVALRDAIQALGEDAPPQPDDRVTTRLQFEKDWLLERQFPAARTLLDNYRATLAADTRRDRFTPDAGQYQADQLVQLRKGFGTLEAAVDDATRDGQQGLPGKLVQHPKVRAAHAKLMTLATDLYGKLHSDATSSFERSRANHRRSLSIAGFAAVTACILVLTLMHYFRVWVFRPIRELQAGVQRVHGGNFDHPIRLTSKDELEELADEFNAMTVRLRDIYKNLALQVNERTRQLVRSERMVSVGFLAAGVAHEINNPLASIAFCSEALERRLQEVLATAPTDADVIAKYLRMIQQEAFRCKQITQKLLDFSRSGGKREPVELSALVADVLEVAHHLPNSRGKTLTFNNTDGPVTALVSGPDVKSVVLNLVVNSLDSMEEGGSLTATLAVKAEVAELSFADTGCGMTPDVLENIFEPFFTRNRTGNGTGLGLSISHQIVDQHGGSIVATSAGVGKGSTFVVRLPLRAAEAKPDATTPKGDRPATLPFSGAKAAA